MKKIEFLAPVDYMAGNMSGRQSLTYSADDARGYDVPVGSSAEAVTYSPRLIAKFMTRKSKRYFQVRTRSTVNATARYHTNLAIAGGTFAIFYATFDNAQLNTALHAAYVAARVKISYRAWLCQKIRVGVADGDSDITITSTLSVPNPWINTQQQELTISQTILDKFNDVLSQL